MTILVTGGAGYIGAHVVRILSERGNRVHIVDDLSTGIRARSPEVPLTQVNLADEASVDVLADLCTREQVTAAIHFAARKQVGESVARPAWYYAENLGGLAHLLLTLERADIHRVILSSSAAVYGDVSGSVSEDAPTLPTSP